MTDYGDGPERGNAQTWAFMAAECARLLRERDEARREVKRLRVFADAIRGVLDATKAPLFYDWYQSVGAGDWWECAVCEGVALTGHDWCDIDHRADCPAAVLERLRAEPTDA